MLCCTAFYFHDDCDDFDDDENHYHIYSMMILIGSDDHNDEVCAAPGSCPPLPKLPRGRSVPVRGSRGAAMRFKCRSDMTHVLANPMTHIGKIM